MSVFRSWSPTVSGGSGCHGEWFWQNYGVLSFSVARNLKQHQTSYDSALLSHRAQCPKSHCPWKKSIPCSAYVRGSVCPELGDSEGTVTADEYILPLSLTRTQAVVGGNSEHWPAPVRTCGRAPLHPIWSAPLEGNHSVWMVHRARAWSGAFELGLGSLSESLNIPGSH